MENEVGAALCCNKKCTLGPISKGTSTRVVVDLKCPKGMRPVGVWHSHPTGNSYPSMPDIQNLQKAGLDISCVTGRQGLRCYRIGGNQK